MNEKLTVTSRRPSDVATTTRVPSAFEEAFANEPADLLDPTSQATTPVHANSYSVISSHSNYVQFGNTIKAYTEAGMTYQHIANAAVSLGEKVEILGTDAFVNTNVVTNAGQVIEEANRIRGVQNRGEVISLTPQLSSPKSITGQELVPGSQQLSTNSPQEQKLNVLEGIAVYNQPSQPLSNTQDNQLENNPFLKSLPDKKSF